VILGMSTSTFTEVHVVLSLIGIFSGIIVLFGMFSAKRLAGWTALFVVSTVLTSVTGFFFHSEHFGPPHVVGVISLGVLAVALDLRGQRRARPLSECLRRGFQKLPFLSRLAPTQSEPPFFVAQLIVMAIFVLLGLRAVMTFRPATAAPT